MQNETSSNPFVTTALTVLVGTVVYVLGQVVTRFLLEPIQDLKRAIAETAVPLAFYANVYENPGLSSAEQRKEVSNALRERASRLRGLAAAIPLYWLFVMWANLPHWPELEDAVSHLIGMSNRVLDPNGGEACVAHRAQVERALYLPALG